MRNIIDKKCITDKGFRQSDTEIHVLYEISAITTTSQTNSHQNNQLEENIYYLVQGQNKQ